jgi:DNA-binding FadR family transcriptional regulator
VDNTTAYFILTREMTNMHHSERTDLDKSPQYQEIMDAVKAGNTELALYLVQAVKNTAGDAYRAKRDIPFLTGLGC